jgi:anti-anti-sigma factor
LTPLGDLTFSRRSGVPVAELHGELDLSNTGRIGAEIRKTVGNADPGLIIDLTRVTYLDSSALRLFFELDTQLRARKQRFHVVVPGHAYIRNILRISRLDEKVPVHEELAQAVAACVGRDES